MASDVQHLEAGLVRIRHILQYPHYGASDRKRALIRIVEEAQKALDGAEGSKINPQFINGG